MSSVTWGLGPYVSESWYCHNHFSQLSQNSPHPNPSRKKQVFLGQKDSFSSPCSIRPFRHTPHRGVTPSQPTGRVRYQHPGSDPCHKPECSQEEFSLKATQSHLKCQTAQIPLLLPRTHWSATSDLLITQWELFLLNAPPCQPNQVPQLLPMRGCNPTYTY